MKKIILSAVLPLIWISVGLSQSDESPKLVVGIIVDQMRHDYITRFWNHFGDDGFKRFFNEGFVAKNHHFNYFQTKTGPGHASIATGTAPSTHGIIANDWYHKTLKKEVYCVGDTSVFSVGTKSDAGEKSPHRMHTTTFSDQLRLHYQFNNKSIGISIKDRSAILSAGHSATAAYWFYGKDEGVFVSSSFYMKQLPKWVKEFNSKQYPIQLLKSWNPIKPIETFVESSSKHNDFEKLFEGISVAEFPYDLEKLAPLNDNFDLLKDTPFGNTIVTEFSLEAFKHEELGLGSSPDFLAIAYSSTDYIGHHFGINSNEIQDTYIRLDLEIAQLFKAFDHQLGKGNYVVFLTSDHGATQVPNYLKANKIPAGYYQTKNLKSKLSKTLYDKFGVDHLIENISNNDVFFNRQLIHQHSLDFDLVLDVAKEYFLTLDFVDKVFKSTELLQLSEVELLHHLLIQSHHQKYSGDLIFVQRPSFINYNQKGTTHGSGFNYDTHVPLMFFGKGIQKGHTFRRTEITDIAPTLSALLSIGYPNGSTGNPIHEVLN